MVVGVKFELVLAMMGNMLFLVQKIVTFTVSTSLPGIPSGVGLD